MFVVEKNSGEPIVAPTPQEAVLKYRAREARDSETNEYYRVWNTMSNDFYVVSHNVDWDPVENPHIPELEVTVHVGGKSRKALIDKIMEVIKTNDKAMRQICELAALAMIDTPLFEEYMGVKHDS